MTKKPMNKGFFDENSNTKVEEKKNIDIIVKVKEENLCQSKE